jgi:hypothetical protein
MLQARANAKDEPKEVSQPDPASSLSHDAGLAYRAAIQGGTSLPIMIANIPAVVANGTRYIGDKALGIDPSSPSVPYANPYNEGLDTLGVAKPQNSQERTAVDLGAALASVGTGTALGSEALAGGNSMLGPNAAAFLSQNPQLQARAALGSTLAGDIAKEKGASPGWQLAASLAGGAAPATGGLVKNAGTYLLRGSDSAIPQIQSNIDMFKNVGITPSVAQATQGSGATALENTLGKVTGGSSPMHAFADKQQSAIADTLGSLADQVSPSANPTTAGQAIRDGITESFIPQQKAIQQQLYDKLDSYIPSNATVPVNNTLDTLNRISTPISGAEKTSQALVNGKINDIRNAIMQDTQKETFDPVLGNKIVNSGLPYEGLKGIRTQVGGMLTDGLTSDVPRGQLKQLYAAISQDMESAAKAAGPDAENALQQANAFTKNFHQQADTLNGVVNKDSPESVYQAAMSEAQRGGSKISTVLAALPDDAKKQIAATEISNIGKALASKQNAAGDAASTETFLTKWNKLSPDAKAQLFSPNTVGPDVSSRLSAMANVADNLRQGSKVLSNPSGTAATASNASALTGFLGALATGHPGVAAGIGGTALTARMLAQRLTDPNFVARMASPMNNVGGVLPGTVNALMSRSQN